MTTPKGPTPKRTYFGKTIYQDLRKLDATPNRISPDFPSEKDLLRQKDLVKCFGTDVGPFGVVICTLESFAGTQGAVFSPEPNFIIEIENEGHT